ncbi:MAG: AbiV family abortive infection protein [Anaerolineales bacterium]|nr:AbiV family abortive infection protein [Anaerolineales bacterium]
MDISVLSRFARKILINTWELYEEAKWLNKLGHYARAYALAHLAVEEYAKLTLLSFVAMDVFEGKEITSEYLHSIFTGRLFRDHKYKLRIAFLKFPSFDYQTTIQYANQLNEYKNKSLYSDIMEDHFFKPSDLFNKDRSSTMIEVVSNLLQKYIKEMGIKTLKKIKNVDEAVFFDYFNRLSKLFMVNKIAPLPTNINHVDYLLKSIKNQDTYDNLKLILNAYKQ